MNNIQRGFLLAVAGMIGCAALLAGTIAIGDQNAREEHEKLREQARANLTTARDFTKAAAESNSGSEKACEALKATMREMVVNNLSYADIGTTREKFDMIKDYNSCKFDN